MFDTFGAAFGRLVKRKRAEKRMTQGQLAVALYPNLEPHEAEARKGDISKLENGKVPNPTTTTIQKLATALGISDEEIDALQHRVQATSMSGQLDNIPTLSREQLENLAARFGIEDPYDKGDEELRGYLTDKARDYRDLRQQIAALDDSVVEIANLKAEAEGAATAGDLEQVEKILVAADVMETAVNAQTKMTRATNALLRNRPEQAFEILSAIADSFRSASPLAPVVVRTQLYQILFDHGKRYGRGGLALSERMLEDAEKLLPDDPPSELIPLVYGNLAVTRHIQASLLAGKASEKKFSEAISAYRSLLGHLPENVEDWAGTQRNLGDTLCHLASRSGPKDGIRLLSEAVTAYQEALTIFIQDAHPVQWAATQNNLGAALTDLGLRKEGADGTRLLDEAVTSYRDALTVRTKDDHPVDWAATQNNLGNALQNQGTRTEGADGTRLLDEAVTAFRDTLTVRTKKDYPVQWAMTQENLAIVELAIAAHNDTTSPSPHLEAALDNIEAALTVFDPEHMSYNFQKATRLRDRIKAKLDALD